MCDARAAFIAAVGMAKVQIPDGTIVEPVGMHFRGMPFQASVLSLNSSAYGKGNCCACPQDLGSGEVYGLVIVRSSDTVE